MRRAAGARSTVEGKKGFASGQYLKETDDPEAWPRAYETGKGRMVLYQPQFTDWTDFRTIEALVAAEYVKAADAQLTYARRIAPAEISLTNTGG